MKDSQSYFSQHPDVNEFYHTSDGQHFFKEADAQAHAGFLKDGVVTKVTRAEMEAWADNSTGTGDSTSTGKPPKTKK